MAKVPSSSESTQSKRTKITCDRRLDVDDNIFIRYADLGPRGSHDVVLLLHGLISNSDNQWGSSTGISDALVDAGYRCILPDFRGHGGSSKPYDSSKYGVCIIEDLVKLLDHLRLAKVHVLAYSMGAEVAIFFTSHHQDRVKSLCIGGSGWSDSEIANVYKSLGKCCAKLPGMPCNVICWSRVVWYPCCCPLFCHCVGGFVPDMKASVICAKRHGEELVDLPEEKVKNITVPMMGASGETDPEIKYLRRMEGVVEQFEFVSYAGLDHERAAASPLWKETVLKFLGKQRAGGEGRGAGNGKDEAKTRAPQQEEMRDQCTLNCVSAVEDSDS